MSAVASRPRLAPVARVVNRSKGTVLAERAPHARTFWRRLLGLMGRAALPEGEGLIFAPCRGVHTHFMRFPIDLVFLDKSDHVTKVRRAMPPWRFDFTNADGAIEMNAGAAADIEPGDILRFVPSTRDQEP